MSIRSTLFTLLSLTALVLADKPYWVFFGSDATGPPVQFTSRANARLSERGSLTQPGSLAVSPDYLSQLRSAGFKIRHVSRFLNAVSVEINNDDQLAFLDQLTFISSVQAVAQRVNTTPDQANIDQQLARGSGLSYGSSYTQNQMLNIPALHDMGYDGSGVLIGVFDTGFRTDHPVFDKLEVTAQYDFIDHETDVSGVGHDHGINVLSALGGYAYGELIGPAYSASYLLARTEDDTSETRAEEDNWVAALEWADSLGVDIVSSSVNYRLFDDPADNYPFSAIDGQTAIISRAANIAAARGILVVNSNANEGPSDGSVWPPADSPHVLGVGSVNSQGIISYFSSRGPTYDGRIKPDVVAMGTAVYMASGVNDFIQGYGTSFSTPLVAGLAALLLQAHPELAPDSIITLFQKHGDNSENPDNAYGYGIPDLTSLFQNQFEGVIKNGLVYPNPSSTKEIKMLLPDPVVDLIESAALFDIRGRQIASLAVQAVSENTLQLSLPTNRIFADQLLIITVKAGKTIYSGKLVYIK